MSAFTIKLLTAAVLFVMELVAYQVATKSLERTRDQRIAAARTAGRPEPNDNLLQFILLPGLIILPLIGFFFIGPILADVFGAS